MLYLASYCEPENVVKVGIKGVCPGHMELIKDGGIIVAKWFLSLKLALKHSKLLCTSSSQLSHLCLRSTCMVYSN